MLLRTVGHKAIFKSYQPFLLRLLKSQADTAMVVVTMKRERQNGAEARRGADLFGEGLR